MAAPSHPELDVLIVVRELANGHHIAFPAAAPELVSYGSETSCLEEQRLFLSEHLATLPAERLEPFRLASEVHLDTIEVTIPRGDLPRRIDRIPRIRVPCLVIPRGDAAWVVALPLQHTFYCEDATAWRDAARDEIVRLAAAREPSPLDYFDLLPAVTHRVERLRVRVERDEHGGEHAADRRQARARELEVEAALRQLAEIGEAPPCGRVGSLSGRDEPLRALGSLLRGEERLSVCVVGREQVGKSALIRHALAGRDHVFVTSGARLIAGQSFFGQWQQRLHDVMQAAEKVDAVLWFDNLADLFTARGGGEDFAGVLRTYLDRRRVRLVGELQPETFDEASLRHVGFISQLHPVRLEPLDAAATLEILHRRRRRRVKGPTVTAGAIAPLVELAERYFPYRAFPGVAVRLFEDLRARHAGELDAAGEPPRLGVRQFYDAVSAETGIPAFLLREDRSLRLEEIRRAFERRVIGQQHAVDCVARTLCTVKASLQPAGRPLAVFLFVGPTGVGKTEVARTLASFLFGDEERMVRFDMSEYADAWAAERLIRGTACEDGLLTRQIRRQPFSVLLLDEIEKASPAVFDLLLQVLGEARLSDARGKVTHFHNTLIIMTSNLGAASRRDRPGFADAGETSSASYYEEQVEEHFRPELVNRLDRVVAFEPLTAPEIEGIATLAVRRLANRHGLAERGVHLEVAPEVVSELARDAYDPAYGARQLHRHLEEHLATPLAHLLASRGETTLGATVEVTRGDDGPRCDLKPAPRRSRRRSARELDAVAELRREVGRHLRLERLLELRDRIELLTVQLSGDGPGAGRARDRRRAVDLSGWRQEHHRLNEIWRRLSDIRQEIEDAEEMALLALQNGEDVTPFSLRSKQVSRRWHRALPAGLLALEAPRSGVALLVRELDRPGALDLWLGPLLEDSERRGWRISAFLLDGDQRWSERSASALTAWLEERATVPAKRPRARLVLQVAGPWAWGLLATEAGLHRFKNREIDGDLSPVHLQVEVLCWTASLTTTQRKLARPLLSERPDRPDAIARMPAVRVYDFVPRNLSIAGQPAFPWSFEDYWPRHEEIAARHLLLFEDDPDRDREEELLSPCLEA